MLLAGKILTLLEPQDHSTFYSGMQRGSTTRRFCLQNHCIWKTLMWPAARKGIWQDYTFIARKLYSSVWDLLSTGTFIEETGVSI